MLVPTLSRARAVDNGPQPPRRAGYPAAMPEDNPEPRPRFLTIDDVALELATSNAQVRALIKRRNLVAIRLGGRGQWRVERSKLEDFIAAAYTETDAWFESQHDDAGE